MKWKRLVVTKGVEIKLSRLFDDAEPLIQGGIMKEKKGVMSLFSLIVSVLLTLSIMPLGAASAAEFPGGSAGCVASVEISTELRNRTDKIAGIGSFFYFDGETLKLSLSEQQLKEGYDFSDADYAFLTNDVLNVANGVSPHSNVHGRGARAKKCGGVYLTYMDLTVGFAAALTAASSVSPAALAATLTAMASAFGPISGVVAGGITIIGAAWFADLAVKIVGAVAQRKGICITATWGIPPLNSAIM